jgi:multiple sugar transport system ATP-binding protein
VYVTHDQVEAMTMGHRVAVLRDGDLQQCDAPATLYHQPTNLFVAGFIGSPAMNTLPVTVDGAVKIASAASVRRSASVPRRSSSTATAGFRRASASSKT